MSEPVGQSLPKIFINGKNAFDTKHTKMFFAFPTEQDVTIRTQIPVIPVIEQKAN